MGDVASLNRKLVYANKRVSYAWARYYESVNTRLTSDTRVYQTLNRNITNNDVVPAHIKAEILDMATQLRKTWECPVCMDMINPDNLDITNCGHYFCKPCLVRYKGLHQEPICPMCRKKI
jgi:hypothetical protein